MVATDQKTQHNKKISPTLISIFIRNLPEPLNSKLFIIGIEKQRFKNQPNNSTKTNVERIIHMITLTKREWCPEKGRRQR